MHTDKLDYDDKRYSEQAMQAIKLNYQSQIYPKSLQNFDNNKAKALAQKTKANTLLDDDVSNWLIHQNGATKRHINEIIRQAMQMQQAMTSS